MDTVVPLRIQILSIIGSVFFLLLIGRLILKGKLTEEYAVLWIVCTVVLLVLSFCVIAANFIMDMLNFVLDPRVRAS